MKNDFENVLMTFLFDSSLFIGSLGILLYTLLSGETPFVLDRNDSHEVILARTAVKLQFVGSTWDRITDHAKVRFHTKIIKILYLKSFCFRHLSVQCLISILRNVRLHLNCANIHGFQISNVCLIQNSAIFKIIILFE